MKTLFVGLASPPAVPLPGTSRGHSSEEVYYWAELNMDFGLEYTPPPQKRKNVKTQKKNFSIAVDSAQYQIYPFN